MEEMKRRLLTNVKDYKRLICIALCAVMALMLIGCCAKAEAKGNERLTVIYERGVITILQDNATGVQYITRHQGGTCVMVNVDGTPYTGEYGED